MNSAYPGINDIRNRMLGRSSKNWGSVEEREAPQSTVQLERTTASPIRAD